jgi:hypothetical protein
MVNVSADNLTAVAHYLGEQERLEPWRNDAACVDVYAEMDTFFPDQADQLVGAVGLRRARLYCARCPVRYECLEVALEQKWVGVWGGTTDEMRAEVAHLDSLPERIRTLDARFFQLATRGPWRIIAKSEFRGLGDGERQHRDTVRPQEVQRNGRNEPARPARSATG